MPQRDGNKVEFVKFALDPPVVANSVRVTINDVLQPSGGTCTNGISEIRLFGTSRFKQVSKGHFFRSRDINLIGLHKLEAFAVFYVVFDKNKSKYKKLARVVFVNKNFASGPDPCSNTMCKNGATCVPLSVFDVECKCTVGYTGRWCDIRKFSKLLGACEV